MLTECFGKNKNVVSAHVYERCGPDPSLEMVSRRKILSRSRDDLNPDVFVEDEEDVWHQKDKLFKDHILEVLGKWNSIDDEIWAKVIVLERNRRVAKAYARAPVLTINGSDDGFDGYRIGLNGFENPMRDMKTEEAKRMIGQGLKVKMDDSGNILVKRISRSNIYVKNLNDDNAIGNDIMKYPNGALESDKPFKLFDMKKFQQNVSKELKRSYPDRKKLETQCISSVAFVKNEGEVLDCPCWVMIINIVAIDMLKSKLPPVKRIPGFGRNSMALFEEDPYSIAGSGSSGSSAKEREVRRGDRPPKLPPRDIKPASPSISFNDRTPMSSKGEYDFCGYASRQMLASQLPKSKPDKKDKKYDDPYYCGMRARIPNFANNPRGMAPTDRYKPGPSWLSSRLYDSGLDSDIATESPYAHIYGRLPLPNRIYTSPPPTPLYVGEWE